MGERYVLTGFGVLFLLEIFYPGNLNYSNFYNFYTVKYPVIADRYYQMHDMVLYMKTTEKCIESPR